MNGFATAGEEAQSTLQEILVEGLVQLPARAPFRVRFLVASTRKGSH